MDAQMNALADVEVFEMSTTSKALLFFPHLTSPFLFTWLIMIQTVPR